MTMYTIYKCDLCKREKTVQDNNANVVPNFCTITKGCAGRLQAQGHTSTFINTATDSILTSWYPRGEVKNITPLEESIQYVLSTSANGHITLAIKISDAVALANNALAIKIQKKKTGENIFVPYSFKVSTVTNIVSGRDLEGKILRFSDSQIADDLIKVRINGVLKNSITDFVALHNQLSFTNVLPLNANINISVFSAKDTEEVFLDLTATSATQTVTSAWSNINYVLDETETKWYLYTNSQSLAVLTESSRFNILGIFNSLHTTEIVSVSNAKFLLASLPYENADRYLNFSVDAALLQTGFNLFTKTKTVNELYTDLQNSFKENYPPIKIVQTAFLRDDKISSSTAIQTDTPLARFESKIIIGPV